MVNPRNTRYSSPWFDIPEWNVAIFAFLLSFVWEIQQMPFYRVPSTFSHTDIVRNCTLATVGDVGITLIAFWTVAALSKSRQWFRHPRRWQMGVYLLVGLIITISFEALATGPLNLWQYASAMPIFPLLGTGLVPVLMWVIIPPLTLWFVKRQLR